MATQTPQKRLLIRWASLRGLAAIILFLIVAILAEYLIVRYATGLSASDPSLLQWSFSFPGTSWPVTLVISPLFHLVPIAVIVTLMCSWVYLTKHLAVRPREAWRTKAGQPIKRGKEPRVDRFFNRIKSGLLKTRAVSFLWRKIRSARPTVKSAFAVLMIFLLFIAIFSLFANPQTIYRAISSAYQNNPALLGFVKGTGEAFAFLGGLASGLAFAMPGIRDSLRGLGSVLSPLADLDSAGKYLVLQNVAAWISALVALLYGEFRGSAFRYRKSKRR